jgi:phospholipid transport system transporter-binding protein
MLLLPATLTNQDAPNALAMLSQALKRETDAEIVIDAASLQQFDSAAIAVLLECQRQAQAWGKRFAVRHTPPKLAALAKLYGVDSLMRLNDAA